MADLTLPTLRSAAIVAVGSELLTPHRTDTNSLAITARLDAVGLRVVGKAVAGDAVDDIVAAIAAAASRADLIILSGGLGPTADDLTRDALAKFLGAQTREDPGLLAGLEARFAARGLDMPSINRRQAMVPEGAETLLNPNGSAPGLLIERGDVTVVALPGPPRELLPMLDGVLAERLGARSAGTPLVRRVLRVTGRAESAVDEIAAPIYLPYLSAPLPVETTILASPGLIELQLHCRTADRTAAERVLDELATSLAGALGPACFTQSGEELEETVGRMLTAAGQTLAVAESCTAGLVAARVTEAPGSSAYFRGGVIAYDNEVKITTLDVPRGLIDAHGAVSEPVALAMADGARVRMAADCAVAVTGIAGPGGGSDAKPVGTVVIASTGLGRRRVRTARFAGDRKLVRAQSVLAALDSVRHLLLDIP